MLQIFFHFCGGVFLSWLVTGEWSYRALWPIIITCNFPTAIYELTILLGVHYFKILAY
jgi:hypothetical protein